MRASVRRRELAIRTALGASRRRIVRQLLTESLVLSLAGGALGALVGIAGVRVLLMLDLNAIPRIGENGSGLTFDWRVLVFSAALSVAAGIVFGLVPAIHASRPDVVPDMNENGDRAAIGGGPSRVRAGLVIVELALALVLLVGSSLLIRSFLALRAVNPGFDPHGVLTVEMALSGTQFQRTRDVAQLAREGIRRLQAVPGVDAASMGCCPPMLGRYALSFSIAGHPSDGSSPPVAGWVNVSPGFFDVFKIPVIRGRVFTDHDDTGSPGVVVINQTMARQFWPQSDPLTDSLRVGVGFPGTDDALHQIVGIVGDVRDGGLDRAPTPLIYVPLAQVPDAMNADHGRLPMQWAVRTRMGPHTLSAAIQAALRDATGGLPPAAARSMDDLVRESTARGDFNTMLMSLFGCAALVLAVMGVYGVMAFVVQQRRREIGIRLALGASSRDIRNMVLKQGLALVLVGAASGVASAFALTRLLAGFLFGVTARDPLAYLAAPAILATVSLIAVWVPARHAMHVDPVVSLKSE